MHTVQIDHTPFNYIEEGTGNPVVFIHGSIDDYRAWTYQIPFFSKQFHTIAYSRRFHYPEATDEPADHYSVTTHAKDLAAFLETLNLKKPVHLIGSSYGAYISLRMALNQPDTIRSLVLCEPPVIPLLVSNPNNPLHILSLLIRDFPTGRSFLKFGIKAAFPATKQMRNGNINEGVRLFANGVLGPGGFESLPEKIQKIMLDNAPALKAELLSPGFPASVKDYSGLTVPALLVSGEKSPLFFRTIFNKLHKLIPDSEQIIIPDASHNMYAANSEFFNQRVLKFVKRHNVY